MVRFQLILSFLMVNCLPAWGQDPLCKVSRDARGRIITTCDIYATTGLVSGMASAYKQVTYLGSQYLTFPTWQNGTVRLSPSGKELYGEVAYDLQNNVVLYRVTGVPKINALTPYAFKIRGLEFTRQTDNLRGIDYQLYTTVLHSGRTALLKSLSNRLVLSSATNGYEKGSEFDGAYQTTIKYHIRKGDARPERIELTRKSVVTILQEQAEKIEARLPDKPTLGDVEAVLDYYDSLMTVASINKPALRFDPVFNQFLHEHITYPSQAGSNSIYARVYIGFDVAESGQLKNITLLSPDNVGFGFDKVVKQGLEKLGRVKPGYVGHYALPVAFTFTNTRGKQEAYVPLHTLSADRFGARIILDEFVVPIVVSRPVDTPREVWGFYRTNHAGESSAVR